MVQFYGDSADTVRTSPLEVAPGAQQTNLFIDLSEAKRYALVARTPDAKRLNARRGVGAVHFCGTSLWMGESDGLRRSVSSKATDEKYGPVRFLGEPPDSGTMSLCPGANGKTIQVRAASPADDAPLADIVIVLPPTK